MSDAVTARPESWRPLGEDEAPAWLDAYPKILRLHKLRNAGLRVPCGWFAQADANPSQLPLPEGQAQRWILRSVLPDEDCTQTHLTGISHSVDNLTTPHNICEAMSTCREHIARLRKQGVLDPIQDLRLAWLVQSQIQTRLLCLAIFGPSRNSWYLEIYAPNQDPLSGKHEPLERGGLEHLEKSNSSLNANSVQMRRTLEDILHFYPSENGLEVELVQDKALEWHCVQAKPNTSDSFSQYKDFLETTATDLGQQGQALSEFPRLRLDAEHNPEALSAAHTWLMATLSPKSPGYIVLSGWLYYLVSDSNKSDEESRVPGDVKAALEDLDLRLIPQARQHLAAWDNRWPTVLREDIVQALKEALDVCNAILELRRHYIDPVRRTRPKSSQRTDFRFASTLADRDEFSDILPTRWDIAAPTLAQADLPLRNVHIKSEQGRDDPMVTWDLLEEKDDHLFSIALQAPRKLWLRIAVAQNIDASLLFQVGGEKLKEYGKGSIDRDSLIDAAQRGRIRARANASLNAPLELSYGIPCPPTTSRHLRGIPFGQAFQGAVEIRMDLEELLAHPPRRDDAVLVMPTLTAPSALALHRLGIKTVVCEFGGLSSHGARMAAELNLNALIGCRGCMRLPNDTPVLLDPKSSRLWVLPGKKS